MSIFTIKNCKAEDAQYIAPLAVEILAERHESCRNNEGLVSAVEDHYRAVLLKPENFYVLGAYESNKMIGFCCYNDQVKIEKINIDSGITALFVQSEYRRQGIATQLLFNVASDMLDKSIHNVSLSVVQTNDAAISFYQSLGAVIRCRSIQFEAGISENAFMMNWDNTGVLLQECGRKINEKGLGFVLTPSPENLPSLGDLSL